MSGKDGCKFGDHHLLQQRIHQRELVLRERERGGVEDRNKLLQTCAQFKLQGHTMHSMQAVEAGICTYAEQHGLVSAHRFSPSWVCLSCCRQAPGRRTTASVEERLPRTACLSDVGSEWSWWTEGEEREGREGR